MSTKILQNLNNNEGNYILPFFWQHGESEEVLREYMNAIFNSNIKEVCLEARPHPDFAGDQWFKDFDIILDEAKKLGMKIWILDDAHFPSGQAGGKMAEQPDALQKTYLNYNLVDVCGPAKQTTIEIEPMAHYYENPFAAAAHPFMAGGQKREWTDPEKLVSVVAGRMDGKSGDIYHMAELIDLTDQVKDGVLQWDVPEGYYRLFVVYETHKGGGREGSINFLSKESCKIQITNCYEPHYARYADEFGKTILGFFSDEPEIGNVANYDAGSGKIGNFSMPLPWSEEMPALMKERFGEDYATKLVALWFGVGSDDFTADMRVGYMDIVSTLCKKNFGEQLGDWCRSHGLLYIGHIVEDNNASTGLAASQAHFFRALWGQDWSGIDNIGGQVVEGGANKSHKAIFGIKQDGEFYHHELCKLGVSLADIDPKKHGTTMCETFGAYGWEEGTRLMTYVANHLLVRGVNRFVPHAFSPKDFPDFDCPPHFYAHGKNPLYKPFGSLMKYMNRVGNLINGGNHEVKVAVLYHAESEWAGKAFTEIAAITRILDEAQIDCDIIPADVFRFPEQFMASYDDEGLHINGHVFTTLIVPGLAYVTPETAEFLKKAKETDFLVLFADRVPDGMEKEFAVTAREDLVKKLELAGQREIMISPANEEVQIYHYTQDLEEYILINNENAGAGYRGKVTIPGVENKKAFVYDAFENKLYKLAKEGDTISVHIPRYGMKILVLTEQDAYDSVAIERTACCGHEGTEVAGEWKVRFCDNESYPNFADEITIPELTNINLLKTDWSGIIEYKKQVEMTASAKKLCIEDAFEAVELWVNGEYAGERICPPYCFNIAGLAKDGANEIKLECRTTLERAVHGITGGKGFFGPEFLAVKPSGLLGKVVVK